MARAPRVAELTEEKKRFWEERESPAYESDEWNSMRDRGGPYAPEFEQAWNMGVRSARDPAYAREMQTSGALDKLAKAVEDRTPATENYWYPADYVRILRDSGLRFGGLMEKYGSRDAALQKNIDKHWQPGERPPVPERSMALTARYARNRLRTGLQDVRAGVARSSGSRHDPGATLGQESGSMERLVSSASVRAAEHLPQGTSWERSPSSSFESTRQMPSAYTPLAAPGRGAKRSSR